MKKILALLLCFVMIFSFAACGSDADNTGKDDDTKKEENKTEEEKSKFDFEELVVVDNEDCVIKLTEIVDDELSGFTIKAHIENKSENTKFLFTLASSAINGVQVDSWLSCIVNPGKSTDEEIIFVDTDLEANNIEFKDIELSFQYRDKDNLLVDPVVIAPVHVYPYGEGNAEKFVRNPSAEDVVLVDDENVKIVVIGYEKDAALGYTVKLYLENKSTDKTYMISTSDVYVNNISVDPIMYVDLMPEKCSFQDMTWLKSAFEENDIDTVTKIEMVLNVLDSNDFMADAVLELEVTLKPTH